MIILDEQLAGIGLEREIARWYRGAVQYVVDLRPASVVKDEAIPILLRRQRQATFVTINERDFWRKVEPDARYCIVCFPLPDSRASEISRSLRELLRQPEFKTKAQRMGKVVRVAEESVQFYSLHDREPRSRR